MLDPTWTRDAVRRIRGHPVHGVQIPRPGAFSPGPVHGPGPLSRGVPLPPSHAYPHMGGSIGSANSGGDSYRQHRCDRRRRQRSNGNCTEGKGQGQGQGQGQDQGKGKGKGKGKGLLQSQRKESQRKERPRASSQGPRRWQCRKGHDHQQRRRHGRCRGQKRRHEERDGQRKEDDRRRANWRRRQ